MSERLDEDAKTSNRLRTARIEIIHHVLRLAHDHFGGEEQVLVGSATAGGLRTSGEGLGSEKPKALTDAAADILDTAKPLGKKVFLEESESILNTVAIRGTNLFVRRNKAPELFAVFCK